MHWYFLFFQLMFDVRISTPCGWCLEYGEEMDENHEWVRRNKMTCQFHTSSVKRLYSYRSNCSKNILLLLSECQNCSMKHLDISSIKANIFIVEINFYWRHPRYFQKIVDIKSVIRASKLLPQNQFLYNWIVCFVISTDFDLKKNL